MRLAGRISGSAPPIYHNILWLQAGGPDGERDGTRQEGEQRTRVK